jgi:hypothetical protein
MFNKLISLNLFIVLVDPMKLKLLGIWQWSTAAPSTSEVVVSVEDKIKITKWAKKRNGAEPRRRNEV